MNLLDHDDFSWLVYADWLEERGNPLSEHIRFQVEEDLDVWSKEYRWGLGVVGVGGGVGAGSVVGVGGLLVNTVVGGSINSIGGSTRGYVGNAGIGNRVGGGYGLEGNVGGGI